MGGGTPILSNFSPILAIQKFVLTFLGGKKNFFCKSAPKVVLFLKKQALRNSCELLRQRKELHASSWNFIKAH